jgi:hypothetical protein
MQILVASRGTRDSSAVIRDAFSKCDVSGFYARDVVGLINAIIWSREPLMRFQMSLRTDHLQLFTELTAPHPNAIHIKCRDCKRPVNSSVNFKMTNLLDFTEDGTIPITRGSRFGNGNKETETPLDRPRRMEGRRIPIKLIHSNLEGQRSTGRPRKQWVEDVEEDLGGRH